MSLKRRSLFLAVALAVISAAVMAQTFVPLYPGQYGTSPTNWSAAIAANGTFQTISIPPSKNSVTVENNNESGDNCRIDITGKVVAGNTLSTNVTTASGTITAKQASILLIPGGAFGRYTFAPNGSLVVTCYNSSGGGSSGDSIYVETQ